jgi:hypothetical protein
VLFVLGVVLLDFLTRAKATQIVGEKEPALVSLVLFFTGSGVTFVCHSELVWVIKRDIANLSC